MPVRGSLSNDADSLCRWKEVQLQSLGTDFENKVRDSSAVTSEPFQEVGWKAGVLVWRVTKYRAVHWPIELYGHFYEEDVFLVLHTGTGRSSHGTSVYNLHLWAGKAASSEDYAAGAYKAAELDEKVNFEMTIHRQIPGKETKPFVELFQYVTTWKGSSDNNFFNKSGEAYSAKLLRWFKPDVRSDIIRIKEVPTYKDSLNTEDIMFLDLGRQIYQWVGREANHEHIMTANRYMEDMNADRGGRINTEVINEGVSSDHYFYFYLQDGRGAGNQLVDSDDDTSQRVSRHMGTMSKFKPVLHKLGQHGRKGVSVQRGKTDFKVVKQGKVEVKDYKGLAVALFDSGIHCFVCLDTSVQPEMKKAALQCAHDYLCLTDHPLVPISIFKNGHVTGDMVTS